MKLIKGMYWNQYLELNPKGKGDEARKNGTLIITIAVMMNLLTLMFLLVLVVPGVGNFFESLFSGMSGRSTGKLLALLLLAMLYPIIHYTLGTQENFKKTIIEFESLPADEQNRSSTRSLRYFLISIVGAIATGLLMAL